MRVPVTKMHGTRNDFVILDQRTARVRDLTSFARWACDRHAGIGADGVIAIESSEIADLRMRTINVDGSEAEMCGNGIRCAARWVDEAGEGDRVAFETGGGLIETQIVAREPAYSVRVAMGEPRISAMRTMAAGEASFVELGNPHVVLLSERVNDIDLVTVAQQLQGSPLFPDGVNVHVAALEGDGSLRVRHWERGVGLTMACGTGAVACAAAALEKELLVSPVEVRVPGGQLAVEWDGCGRAYLIGPAVRVFDTEVQVDFGAGG
jgi:diaminopimelate epimerase